MNFSEYQNAARKTAIYPQEYAVIYPAMGLAGEAGEVLNKLKKTLRGDTQNGFLDKVDEVGDEIGDVLWYCANLAYDLGLSLDDIATFNIERLADRQERSVLKGTGDVR